MGTKYREFTAHEIEVVLKDIKWCLIGNGTLNHLEITFLSTDHIDQDWINHT